MHDRWSFLYDYMLTEILFSDKSTLHANFAKDALYIIDAAFVRSDLKELSTYENDISQS